MDISQYLLPSSEHHSIIPSVWEKKQVTSGETQSASDATSLHEDEDVSEVESNGGGGNQGLPLMVISNNEVGHESKLSFSNTNKRTNLPAQLEMTMKGKICAEHSRAPEEYCWHIIFGLVNHEPFKVAVYSLSFWSLEKGTDVSTIKWPKGGIILKEAPSFLCYSCQIRCKGPADSPRVAFCWQYRSLQKFSHALKEDGNERSKDLSTQPPLHELHDKAVVEVKDAVGDALYIIDSSRTVLDNAPSLPQPPHQGPFYKRLGNFLPWKDSCKKEKMSMQ